MHSAPSLFKDNCSGCCHLLSAVPPSFLVRPRNQTAVTNSIIILQFSTDGYPWPTVTWFFNAKALVNGFKHQIASNSLTVRNTSSTDIGWYTCRISNVAGSESSNVYIDVQGELCHLIINCYLNPSI